jgi:drug/metabolite transporter (DMT)-like permease
LKIWIVFCAGFVSAMAGLIYTVCRRHRFSPDLLLFFFAIFYTLFAAVYLLVSGGAFYSVWATILGICTGVTTATIIRLMFVVTTRVKLNISWTVIQFSVLIPFFLSVVVYREALAPRALIGVACIFTSIPFIGFGKGKGQAGVPIPNLTSGLLLFTSSFLTGVLLSIPKIYAHMEPGGGTFTLLFYSGLAMIPLSLVMYLLRTRREEVALVGPGIVVLSIYMALANLGSIALLLTALRFLDGSVVYPLRTVVNVLSIFLLTFILFREKATVLEGMGAVVALAGLVLVSATMG